MYESNESRYHMILGWDLLMNFGIGVKLSEKTIKGDVGPYKGCTATMVNLNAYEFKHMNGEVKMKP